MTTRQLRDPRMADAIRVAREYFRLEIGILPAKVALSNRRLLAAVH